MKKPELRDYQKECIDIIYEHFKNNNRQLIQLPTGGGKTFIFLNYLRQYSRKALIVAPSKELLEQIYHWGKIFCDDRKIFLKTRDRYIKSDLYIVSAASLNFDKTKDYFRDLDIDHIVIDEAHHAQAKSYKSFLKLFEGKPIKILGCTATPERLDERPLLEIFDTMTFSRNVVDMIREGYLCDLEATRIKTNIKCSTNWIRQGDFSSGLLRNLDNDTRNKMIYDCYFENCKDLKTLIFCLNVEHANRVAKILDNLGIRAASIHGNMPKKERDRILKKFKNNELDVLTNCQLLTEGFDEPSIEALIIARPTLSKSLYTQMVGRGLRNFPGKKNCKLFELTDNAHKICTFNVLTGFPQDKDYEYKPKTKLLDLVKEHAEMNFEIEGYEKEELNLFEPLRLSYLNSVYMTLPMTEYQKKILKDDKYNYLEAAFIIWKEKLKEKYGKYNKKGQLLGSENKKIELSNV